MSEEENFLKEIDPKFFRRNTNKRECEKEFEEVVKRTEMRKKIRDKKINMKKIKKNITDKWYKFATDYDNKNTVDKIDEHILKLKGYICRIVAAAEKYGYSLRFFKYGSFLNLLKQAEKKRVRLKNGKKK